MKGMVTFFSVFFLFFGDRVEDKTTCYFAIGKLLYISKMNDNSNMYEMGGFFWLDIASA